MNRFRLFEVATVLAAIFVAPAAFAQTPVNIAITSGNGQVTCPLCTQQGYGLQNFDPLQVKVTDANGNPVSGAAVSWSVTVNPNGQGAFASSGTQTAASTTDVNGNTGIQYLLQSAISGSSNNPYSPSTITASIANNASVTFYLTQALVPTSSSNNNAAVYVTVEGLTPTSVPVCPTCSEFGDTLTGNAGSISSTPFEIAAYVPGLGAPIPNISLRLISNQGSPAISCVTGAGADPGSVLTNANGIAICTPIFGPTAGVGSFYWLAGGVVASAATGAPLGFAASGSFGLKVLPGVPGMISIASGNNQGATPGQAASSPLVATVGDASGNPLSGQSVVWTVSPAGAATLSNTLTTSNSSGQVSTNVTLTNSTAGAVQVKVALASNPSISTTFTVTACVTAVSFTSPAVAGTAGTLTLTLSGGSCGWSATSSTPWLMPAAASGTSGTLNVAVAANTTGEQRSGTLTVSGQTVTVTQAANNANRIPSLISLSPYQGQGSPATLTLAYAHPNGWAAIQSAQFIMNPNWERGETSGGCLVQYAPGNEQWTLIGDDGVSVAGTATQGAATTLSNSQCSLNVGSSSVTGSGTTLTMVASLTFTPSFTGQRHIWMEASDYNNMSTNWLVYGVWFPATTAMVAEPWWQIYDPFTKNWLYSGDPNEYATLGTEGFTQQGELGQVLNVPGVVGGLSNIIWYRAYVNSTASHFWTSDRNEFLTIINQQSAYVGEGVAAFVMPYINSQGQQSPQVTNTVPFYRGVYTGSNLHFWTVAATAFNAATGYGEWPPGYVGEGIACYIFPIGSAQFSSADPAPDALPAAERDDVSPSIVSVSNGASYARTGVIAPGQLLNIHGRHLGGTVILNGLPAPVVSAGENQIRVVAPQNLAGATEATLEVESQGRRTKPVTLRVVQADPAILGSNVFGKGNAQAMNEDGTANGAQHPATRGSVVTLYTTGYSVGGLPMEVHIGGYPAQIVSTQVSATRAGVVEVQVRVPDGVAQAAFQPVVLQVGHLFSQPGIGLAIQ